MQKAIIFFAPRQHARRSPRKSTNVRHSSSFSPISLQGRAGEKDTGNAYEFFWQATPDG